MISWVCLFIEYNAIYYVYLDCSRTFAWLCIVFKQPCVCTSLCGHIHHLVKSESGANELVTSTGYGPRPLVELHCATVTTENG